MVTADFNADGDLDLAVVSAHLSSVGSPTPGVEIFYGDGSGEFSDETPFPTQAGPNESPISLAVADFNNDGNPDLAVANSTDNTVSVLLSNANGTFQTGVTLAVGANLRSVAATDFNGDGKADLVAANFGDNTLSVFLGRGNGTFQVGPTLETGPGPFALVTADWRVDAQPNVAVLQSNERVRILAGHGAQYFTPGNVYDIVRRVPRDKGGDGYFDKAFINADFNGDGKPDVATPNAARNVISVRLGVGVGTLADAIEVAYPSDVAPISMVAGDFGGDGKTDLITGDPGTLSWLRGKGDGTFHAPVTYSFPTARLNGVEYPYVPFELAVGDINGDGHSDLVIRLTKFASSFQFVLGLGIGVVLGNGDGTFRGEDATNGVLKPFLYLYDRYNEGPYQAYRFGSQLAVGDLVVLLDPRPQHRFRRCRHREGVYDLHHPAESRADEYWPEQYERRREPDSRHDGGYVQHD
jgi:hypothetical protein